MNVINPYPTLGAKHKDALDYIILNLPQSPTFDDLNNALTAAFFGTPDPLTPATNELISVYLNSILPFTYNQWGGIREIKEIKEIGEIGAGKNFTAEQLLIINSSLLIIKGLSPTAFPQFFANAEEKIATSGLSFQEQTPLFIAVATGRASYEYWSAQITSPQPTWVAYLNPSQTLNYLNLPLWVSAAMAGVLIAYGLVKPPDVQLIDIMTGVVGGAGLVAGGVVWGW